MALIKNEIWIINDHRAGNYSQAAGLAYEISALNNFVIRIIDISYGFFSFLPNFILRATLIGVDKKTREKLRDFKYFPSLIISAGRRSAMVSLYIKKMSQGKSKIAQIMNPNFDFAKFDFVILPQHDNANSASKNIITTIGSLTKTNEQIIKKECEKFSSLFSNINKIKIALLIGGDTKNTQFSLQSLEKLVKKSCEIAKNMNACLLVLNSRRTSLEATNLIKSRLDGDCKFFNWHEISTEQNPYLAILGFADFVIASGDSVSMISESCSTGKSVYIFDDKKISSAKHKKFHQQLIVQNYAQNFGDNIESLENFSPKILQETKRIAMMVVG